MKVLGKILFILGISGLAGTIADAWGILYIHQLFLFCMGLLCGVIIGSAKKGGQKSTPVNDHADEER